MIQPRHYRRLPNAARNNSTDLSALKAQLDQSSGINRALGLVFVSVLMYVGITLASVTDLMLLLPDTPVQLPLLSIDIPLFAFFAVTPLIVLGLHLNILLNLREHSKKLFRWIEKAPGSLEEKRTEVHPFLFNLIAFAKKRKYIPSYTLPSFLIHMVAFYAPLVLLLIFQVRFSDYHDLNMSRWHMLLALMDAILLIWLQPNILNRDNYDLNGASIIKWMKELFPKRVMFFLFVIGNIAYSIDNMHLLKEVMEVKQSTTVKRLFEHEYQFPEDVFTVYKKDSVSRALDSFNYKGNTYYMDSWPDFAREHDLDTIYAEFFVLGSSYKHGFYFFTDTLNTFLNIQSLRHKPRIEVEEAYLMASEIDANYVLHLVEKRELSPKEGLDKAILIYGKGIDLKNRHLNYAKLNKCVMDKADLRGASLCYVSFKKSDLRKAKLRKTQLQGAFLVKVRLQGADLSFAKLQKSNFNQSQLQGTCLQFAELQEANLSETKLYGADLSESQLHGTDLTLAQLQGANLTLAQLQGSDFTFAQLQKADLSMSELQAADLDFAQLQDANFNGTNLKGVNLPILRLQEISLTPSQLQGVFSYHIEMPPDLLKKILTLGYDWNKLRDFDIPSPYANLRTFNSDSFLKHVDSLDFYSDEQYNDFKSRMSIGFEKSNILTDSPIEFDKEGFTQERLSLLKNEYIPLAQIMISKFSSYDSKMPEYHNDLLYKKAKDGYPDKWQNFLKTDDLHINYYPFSAAVRAEIEQDIKNLQAQKE